MRRKQRKTDNLTDLRKRLGSLNSDVRYQAYLDAQDLSAEQLWEIAAVPARRTHRSSRMVRVGNIIVMVWVTLALCWAIRSTSFFMSFIISSIPLAWVLISIIVSRRVSQHCLYMTLTRLLEHQEEARFVGPTLLIYLEATGQDVQASARQTLLRLMPLLDDKHMAHWTGRQKAVLLELARNSWGDLELKFFALDALARVGEANSVAVVRDLAEAKTSRIAEQLYGAHIGRETTLQELERDRQREQAIRRGELMFPASSASRYSLENLDVQERETYMAAALYLKRKAEDSLNSILARQQQQKQAAVLLRAVEQPDRTQALLRPVHDAGANTPNEQLLRPK